MKGTILHIPLQQQQKQRKPRSPVKKQQQDNVPQQYQHNRP